MAQKKLYKVDNKKNRTLVMFSGGLDSTAALWHVLNRPKKYGEVHVHHIHIQNFENRWRAEAMAVKAVLDYMREHTSASFTTSESTFNTPHLGPYFLYDTELVGYMTGYMTSRDPQINKVVTGATGTDLAVGASERVSRAIRLHNAFHPDAGDHGGTIREFPFAKHTKAQVYKTLPPDLALLTWSCRRPRYVDGKPVECGKCKTCTLEMQDIKRPKPQVGDAS